MTGNSPIKRLDASASDFSQSLDELLQFETESSEQIEKTVRDIIADVRTRGDQALLEYTNRFDRRDLTEAGELVIDKATIADALHKCPSDQVNALRQAAERITAYHEKQQVESWQYTEESGTVLGQKVTPLDRVGLYTPGGKAAYPSTVLMATVPAKVAGVRDVVLVTPAPDGHINPLVLAAAGVAGVDRIITVGGAQAVAALAYGTETVPKVDKIVGPGNIFVATAKRQVFGVVDIDMIAGPSEILIISEGTTPPDWLAMDLFSQAEHDEKAQAILISPDSQHLEAVQHSIEKLLPTLDRADIVRQSLAARGALIKVDDMAQAINLANRIAPEHLELSIKNPEAYLDDIRHAGAIFLGRHTSEALGDYCAGPNHTLPTSGTARFSSPLGVYDYVKRSSIIHCSSQAAADLGKIASVLARGESLEAHARSAEYRIPSDD